MIVDTHCHLNFDIFQQDLDEVLARAKVAGVGRIVIPATDLYSSREIVEFCDRDISFFGAVGIHPNEAGDFKRDDIKFLRELIQNENIVAIGEIGLDKYHHDVAFSQQVIAFEAQLELAAELKIPVIIHNREADMEMVKILKNWVSQYGIEKNNDQPAGIMHAFSSSQEIAQIFCDMGFFLGFAGPVTYKNAVEKREVLSVVDKNRIVIETDAPFLSPVPHRGKRNEPSFTTLIVDEISRVWDISPAEVEEITTRNAFRIFKWTNLNLTT